MVANTTFGELQGALDLEPLGTLAPCMKDGQRGMHKKAQSAENMAEALGAKKTLKHCVLHAIK